jgi:excinuclease ABC subunit B
MFEEWEKRLRQTVFVSATPGPWELARTGGEVVEQVIRPTGLLDPLIEIVPAKQQVVHLSAEIERTVAAGQRVLVTTLTKKLAEDLTAYFQERNVRCRWLHSELDAFERVELLRELRAGTFDVLVGVNLLREGLDLPEVSLVAILDADKEGFLRGQTALIQTIGRAARNVNGRVIMYGDKETESIKGAVRETQRRREIQLRHNEEHGITPETIIKGVSDIAEFLSLESPNVPSSRRGRKNVPEGLGRKELTRLSVELEEAMFLAADELRFEEAARLRDEIKGIQRELQAL